jgi:GxGYxY sequence motif in domain of unknown function N-terminal/GxGYxYP putative glycoside hydrolase C-terminal domain
MIQHKHNIKNGRGGDRERGRQLAQRFLHLPLSPSPLLPLWFIALLFAITPATAQQLPTNVDVWTMGNASQNVLMSTLAGIVNRNTNGALLLSPNNGTQPNPLFWLNQLKATYPQVQTTFQSSPSTLLNKYKSMLSGYVLYDRTSNPDSVNIATSIAGVTNSIAVDSSTQSTATLAGLSQVADARTMTYAQAYAQYGSQFNKDMLFHQNTSFNEQLRDYAVMNRGFMFYNDPASIGTYAANQNKAGRVFGFAASEEDFFTQSSQNNQQAVASDYSWSTSTTARWQVPLAKQKYHAPTNLAPDQGKHYVAFVMSDGDNAQWLSNGFATDPKWYGSPSRGNFDMTWDLTSSLTEMNPVAYNYIYGHASNGAHHDNFVSPGGAGLSFPSKVPDIATMAASIGDSLDAADQRVVSILDSTYNTTKLGTILDDPSVMGMMYKTYDSYYKGRNGALQFRNGKPILSVKYSLWDGADTAQSIAAALNADTHRNGYTDSASFTIVNVHPWSVTGPDGTGTGNPMSNLNQLVQWLDPTKVDVVTLEDLMVILRNNFGTPVGLPGDYNNDNRVDAADYILWRKTAGTSNLAADGNNDGVVDTKDFDIWRSYFGKTFTPAAGSVATGFPGLSLPKSASALPIPEPASLTLLFLTALALTTGRARPSARGPR